MISPTTLCLEHLPWPAPQAIRRRSRCSQSMTLRFTSNMERFVHQEAMVDSRSGTVFKKQRSSVSRGVPSYRSEAAGRLRGQQRLQRDRLLVLYADFKNSARKTSATVIPTPSLPNSGLRLSLPPSTTITRFWHSESLFGSIFTDLSRT